MMVDLFFLGLGNLKTCHSSSLLNCVHLVSMSYFPYELREENLPTDHVKET